MSFIDEFKEKFDSLDILDQIRFVVYYDSNILLSREEASRILALYLVNRIFKTLRNALLNCEGKDGNLDES